MFNELVSGQICDTQMVWKTVGCFQPQSHDRALVEHVHCHPKFGYYQKGSAFSIIVQGSAAYIVILQRSTFEQYFLFTKSVYHLLYSSCFPFFQILYCLQTFVCHFSIKWMLSYIASYMYSRRSQIFFETVKSVHFLYTCILDWTSPYHIIYCFI